MSDTKLKEVLEILKSNREQIEKISDNAYEARIAISTINEALVELTNIVYTLILKTPTVQSSLPQGWVSTGQPSIQLYSQP